MRLVLLLTLLVSAAAVAAPKKAPAPTAAAAPAAAVSEEVNALALTAGAREISENGTITNTASGLTDGGLEIWQSWEPQKDGPTIGLTYQLAEPFDLTRAEVVNSPNERDYPDISTKRVRIESGPSHEGPWREIGEASLKKGTQPQAVALAPSPGVRFVRVTLLENYGNAEWWSIAELRLFGRRAKPRTVRFNGTWDTSYGTMRLDQVGDRVTGCYGPDGEGRAGSATVEGTVEGGSFFGTWIERGGDDDAGNDSRGIFAFVLTAEGELSGVYGSSADGSDRNARWDGTPVTRAKITCEKPERDLARDLAEDGRVVLRGILFDTGKDVIRPESVPVLEALAAAMKADAKKRYLVEGHTDDRGGAASNLVLSEQRAKSVRAWLVAAGIAAARLETKGYGLTKPTLPNDSEAGRAANRRVEVSAIQ